MPSNYAAAPGTTGPQILDTAQLLARYARQGNQPPHLELPDFQRDYVWGVDQWGQLWDDLVELPEDGQHFMGCLTLQKTGSGTFQILDGQQRLTTAMVLLDFLDAHVGKQACSLGNLFANANVLFRDVLGQEEEADQKAEGEESKRTAEKKKKRYQEIFEYFAKRYAMAGYPDQRPLLDKLERRFFWLVDEIRPEDNAHRTFEQLNATGKPLAYADFLLSYLLELHQRNGGSITAGVVKARWKNLLASISQGELYEAEEALVQEDDKEEAADPDEAGDEENAPDPAQTPEEETDAGEDSAEEAAEQPAEQSEEKDGTYQPLKLKKFLNALGAVTLIWGGSVPETVESFQKTVSLLCGKAPEKLKAEEKLKAGEILTAKEILETLETWAAYYLALTNPRSEAYSDSSFEKERYYLSTLHTAALPMAMRVLDRLKNKEYQEDQVKAIFGAVVRFSLYQRIYVARSGSGLKSSNRKIMMLDYILDALEAGKKFPLTMQNVLGIIMGGTPWQITKERLQETPYSSSVSKVLLCIAYDRWADQHPGSKRIPELEREIGPFQVEHMVARNLPDGAFGAYGFDVTTVDRSENLILLEQKLNNSLNNQTPAEKMKEGWQSSCLYGYYQDLSTFPADGAWSGLYKAQEKRMDDLWESFRSYMVDRKDPIPKNKRANKYPVLWVHKKADIPQWVEPAWGNNEGKEPTQQMKLYSLDKNFMYQLEPKKEDLAQAYYLSHSSFRGGEPQKNNPDDGLTTNLELIGRLFLQFLVRYPLVPTGTGKQPLGREPLFAYVASLPKEDPVYKLLAITGSEGETPTIRNANGTRDLSVKWKWTYLESEMGAIWLNVKLSVGEFCRRLGLVYEHFVRENNVSFGFWVEVKRAVVQSVGGRLYYEPYINVGDPEAYRKFLESKTKTNQTRLPRPAAQPVGSRWFRVDQKELEELLKFHLTIPEYQRRYVWNRRNWQEMLDYLLDSAGEDIIPYGMIILCKDKNSGSYAVVDGQQRLTTLANFWAYACGAFPTQCGLRERKEIQNCLQGEPGAYLQGLLKKVRFTVLYLEGNNLPVTCPYQVFSAINGKGRKLTTAEKMKNLLFELLEKKKLDTEGNKETVVELLQDIRFPKAWLEMRKKEHISDETLYGECKAALSQKPRPGSDPLKKFLACGQEFKKYLMGSKTKMDPALRREILFYRSLGVTTGDALILSWLTSLTEADAAKKLKKLNTLYFLLYVMDRNGNDKKSINSKLPRLAGSQEELTIRSNGLTLLNESLWRDDFEEIRKVWEDFVCTYDLGGTKKAVARFLLLRIEYWLGLPEENLYNFLKEKIPPEVEHIRPISDPVLELHMNCLENICLLEKRINTSVSDKPLVDMTGKAMEKLQEAKKSSEGQKDKERKGYFDSKLVMPRMFYDHGERRWYDKEKGTYGRAEAEERMAEIWNRIEKLFCNDVNSILPSQEKSNKKNVCRH